MAASHCCVPCCTNDSRKNDKDISFHKFPTEEKLRKLWVIKIRRIEGKSFKVTDAAKVCSAHFVKEDYEKTFSGHRRLKKGAYPTIFTWTVPTKKRKLPAKRKIIESSHKLCADQVGESSTSTVSTPAPTTDHQYANNHKPGDAELICFLLRRVEILENLVEEMSTLKFTATNFTTDPKKLAFYTGFPDYGTFIACFDALKPTATNMVRWSKVVRNKEKAAEVKDVFRNEKLSLLDQFFLVLCRLRQGLLETDLSERFRVSISTVSRIINTWVNYIYIMLGLIPIWPSRKQVDEMMPKCFKESYPKTRVILDCTELKVQRPSSKVLNSQLYSNYKSHTTMKGLVGITPNGSISFISALYTGSISDKKITVESGVLSLLEKEDQVMVDKGFLIDEEVEALGCTLVIPPFLGPKGQFSSKEVEETHNIARLRIHVERAIARVKVYRIFDNVIPLTMAGSINQIWTVCCLLTNFQGPLF